MNGDRTDWNTIQGEFGQVTSISDLCVRLI